ncbi:MAG: hypothetical protein IJQ61_11870 [Bacteroidales bacterium]|nr:hypothetical protein [Bacteroidales bacterium]
MPSSSHPAPLNGCVDRMAGSYEGQHVLTEEKYRDAIVACGAIGFIQMSVSEIARMYALEPEALRNQLKRHFPDLLPERETVRRALGIRVHHNSWRVFSASKYAPAIELLRNSDITVREAARELGVDLSNLSGWLKRNHPEVLEQTQAGMTVTEDGVKVLRRVFPQTWEKHLTALSSLKK